MDAAETPSPDAAPVVLVQFPAAWGRNVSPFTLKVETWLRLAHIPYTVREQLNPRRAPKGKLPYIEDGDEVVADSSDIVAHLKDSRGVDPDAELDLRQRAEAHALQRMFEEHFYFVLACARWLDDEGFRAVRAGMFQGLPPGVREVAPLLARRYMRGLLRGQGIARHDLEEAYNRGLADLEAAAIMLGDQAFFMGERPCTLDAVAFGFLANLYLVPVPSALERKARGFTNLVRWTERLDRALFARAPEPEPAAAG